MLNQLSRLGHWQQREDLWRSMRSLKPPIKNNGDRRTNFVCTLLAEAEQQQVQKKTDLENAHMAKIMGWYYCL